MNINLVTQPFDQMGKNTLYLDGAYLGTEIDLENNAFSFDHHVEKRYPQTCTALQIALAVVQGLDLSTIQNVFVSSIDADSVLSTLIVKNPHYCQNIKFIRLLQDLSRIDNHGLPAIIVGETLPKFHYLLRNKPHEGEELNTETLLAKVDLANQMYTNLSLFEEGEEQKLPGRAVAFDIYGNIVNDTKWTEEGVSFNDIYKFSGFGIIFGYASQGIRGKVTMGKKPFVKVPSLELLRSKFQEVETNEGKWGGSDSIGGSPFKVGTSISEEKIIEMTTQWLKEYNC